MILMLLIGLVFTWVSTALIVRALVMPRVGAVNTVKQIELYGFQTRAVDGDKDAARPLLGRVDSIANSLGAAVARRFGGLRESEVRNMLMAAGMYRTQPRKFLGYRVLSTIAVPALFVWTTSTLGYSTAIAVLALPLGVAIGWIGPVRFVQRRADRRLSTIDYDLPELIDLLVVTVESGLGLSGSLQIASQRLTGALGDEVRLVMQEQAMGLSTTEALHNMLSRCDTPLMHGFVRAVVQGENLGVSIGQIMRELAVDMRLRRRQAAEERAQKAPTKILFPLVFLIFPAMFVVLLGPAIFAFLDAFGG
jgi:tight adherence protein C